MTDQDGARAAQAMADAWQVAASNYRAYAARLEETNRQQAAHIVQLERTNARLTAAYTYRTQTALAAGLVRFVVMGDRP